MVRYLLFGHTILYYTIYIYLYILYTHTHIYIYIYTPINTYINVYIDRSDCAKRLIIVFHYFTSVVTNI